MKYIWERCDIQVGRRVFSETRTTEYIIGYNPTIPGHEGNLCLIDLADGLITDSWLTAEKLCERFNSVYMRPAEVRTDDRNQP